LEVIIIGCDVILTAGVGQVDTVTDAAALCGCDAAVFCRFWKKAFPNSPVLVTVTGRIVPAG
jgi:hypothetical protein